MCRENRSDPEQKIGVQGHFIEADVAKMRNRVRLLGTFVAVLPSAKNNTRVTVAPGNMICVVPDSDAESEPWESLPPAPLTALKRP